MTIRQHTALLMLSALALYLAGNHLHSLWDRDEARFAEAARVMSLGTDWIIPYFNGKIRYDKPILIYWLMAPLMRLFGPNEFAVRLPAAIAGSLNVWLMYRLARRMGAQPDSAFTATLMFMVSPLQVLVSKAATTDAVLLSSVLGCINMIWDQRTHGGFRWLRHFGIWGLLGLSILLKGPPGILAVGAGWIAFAAWNKLRPSPQVTVRSSPPLRILGATGVLFLLLVCLPWAIAAWIRTDGDFFRIAVGKHVVKRATDSLEGHSGPFWYYAPLLLLSLLPCLAAFSRADFRAPAFRANQAGRFLCSWLLPYFVVVSIVRTKLPHYLIPVLPVPFLALALGMRDAPATWLSRFAIWLQCVAGIAIAIGLIIVSRESNIAELVLPAALAGAAFAAAGAAPLLAKQSGRQIRIAWCASMIGLLVLALGLLPRLELYRATKRIISALREQAPPSTELCAVGYHEPSLVFYWAQPIIMVSANAKTREEIAAWLADTSKPRALVIPAERWEKWQAKTSATLAAARLINVDQHLVAQEGEWQRIAIVGNWPAKADNSVDRTPPQSLP